ncbi:hypothetical protein GW17_00052526, partial [Ensete ventricosum]
KPLQGVAGHGHGQPPCKGDRLPARWRPTAAKAPMQRGGRLLPGPARKGAALARGKTVGAAAQGWPVVARRPQGAAAARGHVAGAIANGLQTTARRKVAYGQRHRPQGLPPARAAPVEVPAAPW